MQTRYLPLIFTLLGAVAMAVLTSVVAATQDGRVDATEWVQVVIQVFTVVSVWGAANIPGFTRAKALMAAIGVVLNLLVSYIIGGIDATEWMDLAIAFLSALGVAAAPRVLTSAEPTRSATM